MIQKNVIIIDDDKDMLKVISANLEKEGYHTVTARTGKEGIEKSQEDFFDIAIVDIKMPDISGVEVSKSIKENSPDTKIVMITGYATVETAVSTLKDGAYDYITKPFKMDELKEIIGKAMEKPIVSVAQTNVLIVDDDEDMLEVISVGLEREEYRVVTALTGEEALERLKEDSFDIAVLDINLPDTNGVKILEFIRESSPETKVVMITGYASVETAVSTLKAGAYDYIKKPFKIDHLKAIIEKAIEEARRERLEQELKESEGQIRLLSKAIETSLSAISAATPDGVFTFQNQAHLDMFGYTNEELYEKISYLDTVTEKEKMAEEVFPSIIQGGWMGELTGIRKDGTVFPMYASCSPVADKDGNLVAIGASIINMTETKELHTQLIRAEKLSALGQMVHGIAHNINNKLAPVLGYAELAKMYIEADDRESLLRALDTIEQSARDTAAQIQRLQRYAKTKTDTRNFVPLDLNDVVKDALQFTRTYWMEEAQLKGISYALKVDLDDSLPILTGQPEELRDIIINIVKNAVEAMPEGGDLSIKTYREEYDEVSTKPAWGVDTADSPSDSLLFGGLTPEQHPSDSFAVVEISDTGMGMSPEIQEKIFDPYFTTKGSKGTGLGLSESFGAITRHSGTIDVESIEGEGSTFYIRLPIPKEDTPEVTQDEKVTPEYSMNILIIDDEETVREVLGEIVKNMRGHYQVDVASSGEEGIEMVARQPYDVVITDVAMPDMNGWEVARYLRDNYPKIVVVFVSGFGISLNEEEIEEAGVSFTLAKPLSADQIQDALVSAYELKREKA